MTFKEKAILEFNQEFYDFAEKILDLTQGLENEDLSDDANEVLLQIEKLRYKALDMFTKKTTVNA